MVLVESRHRNRDYNYVADTWHSVAIVLAGQKKPRHPRCRVKDDKKMELAMLSIFRKLMKNEQGATAIEYVLIASLISVAAITAMGKVGGKVSNVLSNVANAMN
jgi:pilus assembly protein Flp/PilA